MLVSLSAVLGWAEDRRCAIGAYNTPTLESLMAVLSTAEARGVPVILMHAQVHEAAMPLAVIGPVMVDAARRSTVPVCVHLDHGESLDYLAAALDLGFTSVMFDGSTLPYDENARLTRAAVDLARARGAGSEGEIGVMPGREAAGGAPPDRVYTDPGLAARFVDDTGVEALACSFGTVHGFYTQPPRLDFDRIAAIRSLTGRPLVMHGGSGVSPADYARSIACGIRKVNYYSYMAYAGVRGAREALAAEDVRFYHDVAVAATRAMAADVHASVRAFYAGPAS